MLDDTAAAAEMGRAARRRALATHDPDANAAALLRIYEAMTLPEAVL